MRPFTEVFVPRCLMVLVLMFAVFTVTACSQRQAQAAVQSSITALAHGLDATSEVAAEQLEGAPETARQYALQEREQNPEMTVDEGMELYRQYLDNWYQFSNVLNITHHSLLLGQSAVDIWISTGNLPDQWGAFCESIGESLQRLVSLLGEVDVQIPDLLQQSLPYADTMCEMAAAFFTQQE